MDKRALRQELFARVRALSADERRARSATIRDLLEDDPAFRAAGTVFSYLALASEPDFAPLVAAHPGKRWAFPRVTQEDRLVFHEMMDPGEGLAGLHLIVEPDPEKHPEVAPEEADLVLVPGVGFDPATGARLGRGKGHYDRFLAAAPGQGRSPRLVGVAFSTQLAALVEEAHDIPMHRILTDAGWSVAAL